MFWNKHKRVESRIYADAAASTPLSAHAKKELIRLLDLYGNPGALHQEAVAAQKELEKARATIAEAIGAHADEIVFTASGTEANNLAITGALRPRLQVLRPTRPNEKIRHPMSDLNAITSVVEHQSVLAPLNALEREGLLVVPLSVSEEGLVDPKELSESVNGQTALVSIQLINSEMGAVQPIRELAKILRKQDKKILFHVDASQAPLWMDLKVEKLGVDMLTLDAQKILGPKGIGALYIKRGTLLDPVIWGGGQERGLRAGTENVPLAGAFAAALQDAQSGAEERAAEISAVRDYLHDEIKKLLPDIVLHGPLSGKNRVANNLNISVPGLDGEMATIALDAAGIAVSTRSACSTDDEEPSYVIQSLGISPELAKTAIRITLLPDATKAEARRIAQALLKVASRYRKSI